MISYTDLFGAQRAKLVPAAAIADMQKDGAGFAGFATWLDMTPAHPISSPCRMRLGDPAALEARRRLVAADCVMEDRHVAQSPRVVLKTVMANAAKEGLYVKTASRRSSS